MESTTEATRATVLAYTEALADGDVATLRAAFGPDATWTLPGDLPVSGTWTGPGAIMDGFLVRLSERLDPDAPVTQDIQRIVADGQYAVAEWTSHATTRDGRAYDNDNAVAFRVVDGLIVSVTEYTDTAYMRDTLFADLVGREEGTVTAGDAALS